MAEHTSMLRDGFLLLGFALAFVLIFRRLGLGATLGYLVAGAVVGPQLLGLVGDAEEKLGIAELAGAAARNAVQQYVKLIKMAPSMLRAVRDGLMNKEIAARMGLSEVTVKMHVRSICSKLNARNRTQAAIIAETLGLD